MATTRSLCAIDAIEMDVARLLTGTHAGGAAIAGPAGISRQCACGGAVDADIDMRDAQIVWQMAPDDAAASMSSASADATTRRARSTGDMRSGVTRARARTWPSHDLRA